MFVRRTAFMVAFIAAIALWGIMLKHSGGSREISRISTEPTSVLMSTVAATENALSATDQEVDIDLPDTDANQPFFPTPILPTPAGPTAHVVEGKENLGPRAHSYEVKAFVTGYCPCSRCCGRFANGRTATRTSAWKPGIAVDPAAIPYGSTITVPSYGTAFADDTGIAMRRNWQNRGVVHLDLRFTYHWAARQWGTKYLTVTVTPPAPGRNLARR